MSEAYDRAVKLENFTHPNFDIGGAFTVGWDACKKEVLALLKANTYKFEKGSKDNSAIVIDVEMIGLKLKEEVEKL
jgi:hypothetical protein